MYIVQQSNTHTAFITVNITGVLTLYFPNKIADGFMYF